MTSQVSNYEGGSSEEFQARTNRWGSLISRAWGSEPLCSFDPKTGFAINTSTVDELRWYTYLSPPDLDDESLLESRNDE